MKYEPWRRCEDEAVLILRAYGFSARAISAWCALVYATDRAPKAILERWYRLRWREAKVSMPIDRRGRMTRRKAIELGLRRFKGPPCPIHDPPRRRGPNTVRRWRFVCDNTCCECRQRGGPRKRERAAPSPPAAAPDARPSD